VAFHFLVDGYNLLYTLDELPSGSLQDKREKLLRLLTQRRPQGKNKLTVVFDSRQGMGNEGDQGGIHIVFTAGETADDWISARVRKAPQPRTLIVVSNDKGIQLDVRGTGARFISVDEFLKNSQADRPTSSASHTSPSAADAITKELKDRWL
jgi:predicted RNA-binding protein with PIN domain